MGKDLPFEWYNTPNIHLFTFRDFILLCRDTGISIKETVYMRGGWLSRLLVLIGLHNLGANLVIAKIEQQTSNDSKN